MTTNQLTPTLVEIAHDIVTTLSGSTFCEPGDFENKAQELIANALERVRRETVEGCARVAVFHGNTSDDCQKCCYAVADRLRSFVNKAPQGEDRVLCRHFRAAREFDAVQVEPRSWVCLKCSAMCWHHYSEDAGYCFSNADVVRGKCGAHR